MYVCVCVYIYIHTHTHTHTHGCRVHKWIRSDCVYTCYTQILLPNLPGKEYKYVLWHTHTHTMSVCVCVCVCVRACVCACVHSNLTFFSGCTGGASDASEPSFLSKTFFPVAAAVVWSPVYVSALCVRACMWREWLNVWMYRYRGENRVQVSFVYQMFRARALRHIRAEILWYVACQDGFITCIWLIHLSVFFIANLRH